MRRKPRQRQASLFDQVVKGEPAGKSEEEAKPTQSAPEGEGIKVAINYGEIDDGEPIRHVMIETPVEDGYPVLIETIPLYSYPIRRVGAKEDDDLAFAEVAKLSLFVGDKLVEYRVVKHLSGKYAGQLEMCVNVPEDVTKLEIDFCCPIFSVKAEEGGR